MKVKLLKLNTPVFEGLSFDESGVLTALAVTVFPLWGKHIAPSPFEETLMHAPNTIEFKCHSMWLEGEVLMGELEFFAKDCWPVKFPKLFEFYPRVMPRDLSDPGAISITPDHVVRDFYFSSVGYMEV